MSRENRHPRVRRGRGITDSGNCRRTVRTRPGPTQEEEADRVVTL